MQLASFRRITLAWALSQCVAFAACLVLQPQGHFPSLNFALISFGFAVSALVGFGIGVISYVVLQILGRLNRAQKSMSGLTPWQLAIMATVSIVGGTFALASVNQIFPDGNLVLFALMVMLSSIAFTRSVVQARH